MIRARHGEDNQWTLHREDLSRALDYRRKTGKRPPTLVELGVFGIEHDGKSGFELPKSDGSGENVATLMDKQREVKPEYVSEAQTLTELAAEVLALKAQMRSLAFVTGGAKLPQMQPDQCLGLLEQISAAANRKQLSVKDIDQWIGRLGRLGPDHFSMLSCWQKEYPNEAALLGLGVLPSYTPIVRLAHRIERLTAERSGAEIVGTLAYNLKLRAARVSKEIQGYATAQASLDSMLDFGSVSEVPVGHCALDQFILTRLYPPDPI